MPRPVHSNLTLLEILNIFCICKMDGSHIKLQGDSVDAIYFNFAKAFDTVSHQRLQVKLAGYGIGGKVLQWIAAFLEGRCQRVLVNGSKLSWSLVTSGIPQRNVLGPMLFVCYISDMSDVVDSPIHMLADDTKIFRQMTAQSDQGTLQTDLRQLEARTRKWPLRINEEKCKVMHLGQYNYHYMEKIPPWGRPQIRESWYANKP